MNEVVSDLEIALTITERYSVRRNVSGTRMRIQM